MAYQPDWLNPDYEVSADSAESEDHRDLIPQDSTSHLPVDLAILADDPGDQ
jgi:hypothetical protein